MSPARHTTHNPRHGLGSRHGWREISTGGTTPMPDSAWAESGARADWQACTTHAFLLDHRTSCTVLRAIVVFAMTIMARSFTTHLTSFVVHRVRFGPDSRESGPNPAPDSPNLSIKVGRARAAEIGDRKQSDSYTDMCACVPLSVSVTTQNGGRSLDGGRSACFPSF